MSIKYVEYLESTGDQHIPLKLDFTNNTRIVMDMMVKSTLNSYFLGNAQKGLNKIGNKIGFVGMTGTASNPSYGTLDVRTVMDYTLAGKLYFDGEEVHDFTNEHADYDTENPAYKVAVFGKDDNFETTGFRLYELKWYEGDELILHLKPCVDNGVGCLYDLVSETYYRCEKATYEPFILGGFIDALYLFADNNEGTAENLGSYRLYNMKIEGDSEGVESGVDYIDYLIGDGNSALNTEVIPQDGYKIECGFSLTSIPNKRVTLYSASTNGAIPGYTYAIAGAFTICIDSTGYIYTTYDNKKMAQDNNFGKLEINKDYVFKHTVSNFTVNVPICLFRSGSGTDAQKYGANSVGSYVASDNVRISFFKIYDTNNDLIYHFVPCLDEENVVCMYDKINNKYIYNMYSGTFKYKEKLRNFQPVLDSNGIPTLMDKVNKKYYYDKNGNGFRYEESCKPVSYLQGDGSSWINTGIIPTTNTKVVVDTYMLLSDLNNGPALFGSTNTFLYFTFQTTTSWLYVGKINGKHSVGLAKHDFSGRHTITIDLSDMTNIVNIDGTNYGTFTGTQKTDVNPILLWNVFDTWGDLSQSGGGTAKIYSFKIYENNVLTMDLIPILDNNNAPCMYDKVSKQFFYNQGDGEFSYGIEELECPPVDYVGYIKNPQTAGVYDEFIKVPNMLFNETWKRIKAKYYTCTNNQSRLWEIYNGRFCLATNYGAFIFNYINEDGENKSLELFRSVGIAPNNNTMMYFDVEWTPGNFNINGMNQTYEGIAQPQSSSNQELRLCSNRIKGGMQYFTVYGENDVILLDLHACVDDNGVACVYDTIAKDFIYPVGTNPFTAEDGIIGYTPIKYIESNGTQYIDTGVVTTDNTDIDMVARAVAKEYTQVEYLQSDGASWINTGLTITGTANYDMEIKYEIVDDSVSGVIMGDCDRYNLSSGTKHFGLIWRAGLWMEYKGFESFNENSNVVTFTNNTQTNLAQDRIGLFATGDGYFPSVSKIYYYKVFDTNDNLINHFIPVLDSEGTPCMYDKVNNQFFYNRGTGTFTHGNAVDKNYLMNDFYIESTYKYKETNTNVEPNLTASDGATLTLGSTYSAYLTEAEIEQAINNGWTIQ